MEFKDWEYFKEKAFYTGSRYGMDTPDLAALGKKWWNNHKEQVFDYHFNSWGFRGPEYIEHLGQPVNICVGDSFTVNVGGKIEHSWCSQLAKNFCIPTLNLGMDGAGNDAIKIVCERAYELFDVQNTFIMYSYLHRRLENSTFVQDIFDETENFLFLEQNIVKDAIYTFLPKWCYSETEFAYLHKNYKKNLFNFDNLIHKKLTTTYNFIPHEIYKNLKGDDWVSYENFCQGMYNNIMLNDEVFTNLKLQMICTNRDGHHLNKSANKIVADFLLELHKNKLA